MTEQIDYPFDPAKLIGVLEIGYAIHPDPDRIGRLFATGRYGTELRFPDEDTFEAVLVAGATEDDPDPEEVSVIRFPRSAIAWDQYDPDPDPVDADRGRDSDALADAIEDPVVTAMVALEAARVAAKTDRASLDERCRVFVGVLRSEVGDRVGVLEALEQVGARISDDRARPAREKAELLMVLQYIAAEVRQEIADEEGDDLG